MLIGLYLLTSEVCLCLQMKTKTKRKRSEKSDKQCESSSSEKVSGQIKAASNAAVSKVKEETPAEVSMSAEVGTTRNRSRKCKQPAAKRRKASSTPDNGPVKTEVDSEIVHDMLPTQRRKTSTSSRKDVPLQQRKQTCQSVSKKRPTAKKQHPTGTRKSASEVQKQKADKEQLETAVVSDVKKAANVKRKLPTVSPIKVVDKTSVKTEKTDVSCTSSSQHSCRKFIGAHMSISGMSLLVVINRTTSDDNMDLVNKNQ